jgi:dihydroorotase
LRLYHSGDIELLPLLASMTSRPADRLGLETGRLTTGAPADVVVFDPDRPWVLEKSAIRSRSKNSPFEDARFSGRVLHTIVAGRPVYTYA